MCYQEKDQWMRLCDRITDRCFVGGSKLYPRAGLLKHADLPEVIMSGVTPLTFENLTSISDICACIKKMEGKDFAKTLGFFFFIMVGKDFIKTLVFF